MSGRLHRRRDVVLTLVLPSVWLFILVLWVMFSCRGDYTGDSCFCNSRSPPMNQILCTFYGPQFWPHFLIILTGINFAMPIGCGVVYTVARPCIMYIYSLRPFLTTKGALIDGDQGGQKMTHFHQRWSKISEKIMKCDQKKRSKLSQKKVILNGKIEKSLKNDQKVTKKVTF